MTQAEQSDDRRRFTRITFDARAYLIDGEERYEAQLVDIALKGFLIQEPEGFAGDAGQAYVLEVHLDGDEVILTLPAVLVRDESPYLGFTCGHLELETVTHLRRLVELNLGDQELLERELEQMLASA